MRKEAQGGKDEFRQSLFCVSLSSSSPGWQKNPLLLAAVILTVKMEAVEIGMLSGDRWGRLLVLTKFKQGVLKNGRVHYGKRVQGLLRGPASSSAGRCLHH